MSRRRSAQITTLRPRREAKKLEVKPSSSSRSFSSVTVGSTCFAITGRGRGSSCSACSNSSATRAQSSLPGESEPRFNLPEFWDAECHRTIARPSASWAKRACERQAKLDCQSPSSRDSCPTHPCVPCSYALQHFILVTSLLLVQPVREDHRSSLEEWTLCKQFGCSIRRHR